MDYPGSKGGRGSLEAKRTRQSGQGGAGVVGACDGHGRLPQQPGRSTSGPAVVRDMALAIAVTPVINSPPDGRRRRNP